MTQDATARFWAFINDSPVKISIRPGMVLLHASGGAHEEGYSMEWIRWEHDGDRVLCEFGTVGRDCDGPHETTSELQCPLPDLRSRIIELESCGFWPRPRSWLLFPAWEKISTSQRDYTAEAAGY